MRRGHRDWRPYGEWSHPGQGAEAWRGFGRRIALGVFMFIGFMILMIAGVAALLAAAIGRASFGTVLLALLLTPIAIGVLGSILGRAFSLAWRPVRKLIDAAGSLAEGDYSARVAESGPPTVRSVAISFNEMATRLESADEQRRRLLADLGHELRTPLTVIRGEIEAMRDGIHPINESTLEAVISEIEVMERLLEDLKTLSLIDAGALALHREPTDLAALVDEVADSHRRRLTGTGVEINVDSDSSIDEVLIDPVRVREVLTNLIINSARAMPEGGEIHIEVGAEPDGVTITVADEGVGIDADELALVFDRFHKGSTSTGSGLGLTISRDLVRAHGGDISIESSPGAGTTVRIELPA